MAQIQPNQIHTSDEQLLNTIQEVKKHAPASSSGKHAQAARSHRAEEVFSRELSKKVPDGPSILGFPWQFILVMTTIAIGVLGLVGKLLGVF
jgi:hypothetical protein